MGTHNTEDLASAEAEREFVRRVLQDVQALELMIAAGAIESGVRRIGAEQEVFLIDRLQSPQFTTELAAHLMDWRGAPQVLVEDEENRLVGIVSYSAIVRLVARGGLSTDESKLPVSSIMRRDPLAVAPETPIVEAIETMLRRGEGALPVLREGRLVGIVSERDLLRITRELLVDRLTTPRTSAPRRRVAKSPPKSAEV